MNIKCTTIVRSNLLTLVALGSGLLGLLPASAQPVPAKLAGLQRYVKTADLDKVYKAIGKVLAHEKPTSPFSTGSDGPGENCRRPRGRADNTAAIGWPTISPISEDLALATEMFRWSNTGMGVKGVTTRIGSEISWAGVAYQFL